MRLSVWHLLLNLFYFKRGTIHFPRLLWRGGSDRITVCGMDAKGRIISRSWTLARLDWLRNGGTVRPYREA